MKKLLLTITLLLTATLPSIAQKNQLTVGDNAHWQVKISTTKGNVELILFNDTPLHRDNFVKLINEGFYNNLLFHRVIKDFMIQCGDPTSREALQIARYGEGDSGYKIASEIKPHYFHKRGVLAAARESDAVNPERLSSGSHFYIVVGKVHNDSTLNKAKERIAQSNGAEITAEREEVYRTIGGTPHLDGSYTIFGEVTNGMEVVEKISTVSTNKYDRPKEDVYIKKIVAELVADKKKK